MSEPAGADGDLEGEIAAIEKRLREDRRGYFKDENVQARYRELIDAREKIRARPAPAAAERQASQSARHGTFTAEDLALIQPAGDVDAGEDDGDIEGWVDEHDRKLIASGAFTREQLAKLYNLPPDQVAKRKPSRHSIEREIAAIQQEMRGDRLAYFKDEAKQARYLELLAARAALPAKPTAAAAESRLPDQGDSPGLPQALLDEWGGLPGGVEHHTTVAQGAVEAMLDDLEDDAAAELQETFDDLPEGVQTQMLRFLAVGEPSGIARPASAAALQDFASTEEGSALLELWGRDGARRLGVVRSRIEMMLEGMSESDRAAAEQWFDDLPAQQAQAVLAGLAGRR